MSTDPGRRGRLLVVASTYPARADDGTPAFVRDLARVAAESFETVVLVPRVRGARLAEVDGPMLVRRFRYFPARHEDLADGAIIENLRARRSRWLQVLPFLISEAIAIRREIRRFQPDVVHLHWLVPQGVAALGGARGRPWVVTTLGGDVYALQDPVSRWLKRAVLRRARAVTAMNHDMAGRLVALGADGGTTHVIPMGADVASLQASAAGAVPVAGRLLFVGRLVEKKGLGVLLQALRLLPQNAGWSLDVVGDGPLRRQLESQAEGLPVAFLGQLSRAQLARALASSEVVVVPSVPARSGDQDGLPVAMLEAMAVGRPVVASRLPGINDAVVDGKSGFLVEPGDAQALAAALGDLLADPARRSRLGSAAAERAVEFSTEALGRRYVDLFHRVMEDGEGR